MSNEIRKEKKYKIQKRMYSPNGDVIWTEENFLTKEEAYKEAQVYFDLHENLLQIGTKHTFNEKSISVDEVDKWYKRSRLCYNCGQPLDYFVRKGVPCPNEVICPNCECEVSG